MHVRRRTINVLLNIVTNYVLNKIIHLYVTEHVKAVNVKIFSRVEHNPSRSNRVILNTQN